MPVYTLSRKPNEIPDLIHWFDANDLSTINTGSSDVSLPNVMTLKDKMSSMVLYQNGHPPKLNSVNINGYNRWMIYFDGTVAGTQSLSGFLPDSSFNTTKTVFLVCSPTSSSFGYSGYQFSILRSSSPLISGSFGKWPDISIIESSNDLVYLETDMNNKYVNLQSTDSNIVNIVSCSINSTSRGVFTNKLESIYTYSSSTPISFQTGSKLIIGDVSDHVYTPSTYSKPYAGPPITFFCELLIYNRGLIDEEIFKINQYLKTKWIG